MNDRTRADVIVIGAGIAGASAADALAADCSVVLIERESQPGYHTTGRSAALFAPVYGPAPIRALTRASAAFMSSPPEGFSDNPILSARGALFIAREDQLQAMQALHDELRAEGNFEELDGTGVRQLQPSVRDGYAAAGLYDVNCEDIDVAALHQGFLRRARARDCTLVTSAEVLSLEQLGDGWRVQTSAGRFEAPRVVNAAGAWADVLGQMAGAEPIGLIPKRRTAMQIAAPDGAAVGGWPIVVDVEEEFYVKPVAGQLLLSPANEDHDVPCDVQPDELDIAICVDRVERAFAFRVGRIETRWAGLRSFVADKCPVAGYSAEVPGFFWLAGQGGYGIQTSPALGALAAALVLGEPLPQTMVDEGVDLATLAPERLSA
ncbi:MAG: FAD-dependent oxidoreductase [Kiloniella sp.]|nr:FAD-dependent oxidoreductase [Kiloniella sp.]RZO32475.1 MAG: FAD-binding oxidoreductase [Rhodospirillaceae bacterium]